MAVIPLRRMSVTLPAQLRRRQVSTHHGKSPVAYPIFLGYEKLDRNSSFKKGANRPEVDH
jgi:hypothetical protein